MRILIFHGYLLGGTGSNVYNAKLAEALTGLGHEVHLLCQDRTPERLSFVDATGEWLDGDLQIRARRDPARCTVYRPDIGGLLPVYVADRYEGLEARPYPDCSDAEISNYVERNVAAVREVVELVAPDMALANHLIMGPLILARSLAGTAVPYAVKVHGSALEYTVKAHPERFLDPAREGVAASRAVLVGSRHTAQSLWAALGDGGGESPRLSIGAEGLRARTRVVPPGVDVVEFSPRDPAEAKAGLEALGARLAREADPGPRVASAGAVEPDAEIPGARASRDAFARDRGEAAQALARLAPAQDRLVAFVGKLIVSKGVDLLLAGWPLVLARVPQARLVVVGFGAYRPGLLSLRDALRRGDLSQAAAIARAGRTLEGGPPGALRQLLGFLDGLQGPERDRYRLAARALGERVVFTGRLEHLELADLLPACEALVVPSTFPEAFGMVAAEAAACGTLPVSAAHSGLAEVSGTLAAAVPPAAAVWLSFPLGPGSVRALADRVVGWLQASPDLRAATRLALVATTRERYSWVGIAQSVVDAALGHLDGLDRA